LTPNGSNSTRGKALALFGFIDKSAQRSKSCYIWTGFTHSPGTERLRTFRATFLMLHPTWLSPERMDTMVPASPPHKVTPQRTILLVDDDGQLQKVVSAMLIKAGYNVILAIDGKDAIQKALEFDGVIHLLLSDIEMPGMTGIELAIQLNHARPHTRILLMSGLDSGMLLLDHGWQFMPKPFMADLLRDRIRDFLSDPEPAIQHVYGT
jgi:CheY-like chemotaxis protein